MCDRIERELIVSNMYGSLTWSYDPKWNIDIIAYPKVSLSVERTPGKDFGIDIKGLTVLLRFK